MADKDAERLSAYCDNPRPMRAGGLRRAAAWTALACCVSALPVPPAAAEKADREKPVHLEADRVAIDDAKQTALFEGNVVLTQGTMQIKGERMEVRQDRDGFKYGITWGKPAYFRQKRDGYDEVIEGWASRIEYDGGAEKMQMFDNARLQRGQDEVRGNYISYDAKNEFFQVTGGGTPTSPSGTAPGRVRAVIQPKPKEKPPAAPPVTLKPADTIDAPRENSGTRSQ